MGHAPVNHGLEIGRRESCLQDGLRFCGRLQMPIAGKHRHPARPKLLLEILGSLIGRRRHRRWFRTPALSTRCGVSSIIWLYAWIGYRFIGVGAMRCERLGPKTGDRVFLALVRILDLVSRGQEIPMLESGHVGSRPRWYITMLDDLDLVALDHHVKIS